MIDQRLQTETHTSPDRYPAIFTASQALSRALLPDRPLKILSFGCSLGEELLSLRRYFPSAELFGCDVDDHALSVARERAGREAVIFKSSEEEAAKHGPFDMVFAMSVLCVYGKDAKNIKKLMPFSQFSAVVESISSQLSVPGILVLYNTSYFFRDLPINDQFTSILHPAVIENSFVTRYTSDVDVAVERVGDVEGYYRRSKTRTELRDSDFTDLFFLKSDTSAGERCVFLQDPKPQDLAAMRRSVGRERAIPVEPGKGVPVTAAETLFHSDDGSQFKVTQYSRESFEGQGRYLHPPLVEKLDGRTFTQAEGRLYPLVAESTVPPIRSVV